MTTKPARPAKKLPKGRVLWLHTATEDHHYSLYCARKVWPDLPPVAVLPCRTAKEARAWVRLHGMSREDMVRTALKGVGSWKVWGGSHQDIIKETLRALGLISK